MAIACKAYERRSFANSRSHYVKRDPSAYEWQIFANSRSHSVKRDPSPNDDSVRSFSINLADINC